MNKYFYIVIGVLCGMGEVIVCQLLVLDYLLIGIFCCISVVLVELVRVGGMVLEQWEQDLVELVVVVECLQVWLVVQFVGSFQSVMLINNVGVVLCLGLVECVLLVELLNVLCVGFEVMLLLSSVFLCGIVFLGSQCCILNIFLGFGCCVMVGSVVYCVVKVGMDNLFCVMVLDEVVKFDGVVIVLLVFGIIDIDMQVDLCVGDFVGFFDCVVFVGFKESGVFISLDEVVVWVLCVLVCFDFGQMVLVDVWD